jgi:NAD(P)-dependent dehydrogenase (short-subunit alcohol dehydrogenase family)
VNRKIALVTGANKGIGKEISRQLAAKDVFVFMGARNKERGEAAVVELRSQGLPVEFIPLDVTSQVSVDAARAKLEQAHGRLDILVNNAGLALDWYSSSDLSMETLEQTFQTNVFGVFRVTSAMIPLLKKSEHARIVNMSSAVGSLTVRANPNNIPAIANMLLAYSSSKAALNMMTIQFANELRATGIKVNSVNPGPTATDMTQNRGVKTAEQAAVVPVEMALLPDDGPTGGFFGDQGTCPW